MPVCICRCLCFRCATDSGTMPRTTRRATHAGSWYEDNEQTLHGEIAEWMRQASAVDGQHARAVIGPHAGYRYCGRVMAYAYKQIDPARVTRVFLLGPSHHAFLRGCALSQASHCRTPLGASLANPTCTCSPHSTDPITSHVFVTEARFAAAGDLEVDSAMVDELRATGEFETMTMGVDEAEHSMELHMPFIAYTLKGSSAKLVPILVGALNVDSEARYGQLLAKYLKDAGNLFVISSDFCHWGSRFAYQYYDANKGPIHKSIEWLDREGMDLIEKVDPSGFAAYLRQYGNTICGRHPIGVFLQMLKHSAMQHRVAFRQYDQSSQCTSFRDSSVSYAAAVVDAV